MNPRQALDRSGGGKRRGGNGLIGWIVIWVTV
jgi:hypothetical protein